jgi:preprotein translocase subunit YajC
MQILIPVVLIALMYVLLIRPQQQRARRQRDLVSTLEVGDRILTVGGLLGTVVALEGDTVDVEAADGVVLTFIRAAISRKLPPDDDDEFDQQDQHDEHFDDQHFEDQHHDGPQVNGVNDTENPNNHEEGAEA